ncbi:MAG: hypothetical protein EOO70_07280, partial [Myxococcaceae bacterium]
MTGEALKMTVIIKDSSAQGSTDGSKYRKVTIDEVPSIMGRITELMRTNIHLQAMGTVDPEMVMSKLKKWITVEYDGGALKGLAQNGKRDIQLKVESWEELALLVVGEVASKPARTQEHLLANSVYLNVHIDRCLSTAIRKLYAALQGLPQGAAIEKELSDISKGLLAQGTYETHFRLAGRLDVLQAPERARFDRKIIVFHDMAEYLQPKTAHVVATRGSGTVKHPREEAYRHATLRIDANGYSGPVEEPVDKSRGKVSLWTRDAKNEGTRAALVTGTPIWAGTSMTTARMLETAAWARCDIQELEAVAWGIFAFWNYSPSKAEPSASPVLYYDRRISPVHTFHEVMQL